MENWNNCYGWDYLVSVYIEKVIFRIEIKEIIKYEL